LCQSLAKWGEFIMRPVWNPSRGRRGISRITLALMLAAALLGGAFMATSAQAHGRGGHRGEPRGTSSGMNRVDLKAWAKAQVKADKARHATPRTKTASSRVR